MTRTTLIVSALLAIVLTACGADATPIPPTEAVPLPTLTFTAAPNLEPTATQAPTETSLPAPTETSAIPSVSFTNDVMPILQSRCLNCHGGESTKEGLSVASYEALMAGSINGAVIVPGDPNNSLFIQLIQNGKMPKRGPKVTPTQLQILIDWILAGAPNN